MKHIGTNFSYKKVSQQISLMKKQVLFIQGGGEDGYTADKKMVDSLQTALGDGFEVSYPALQSDESKPDFGWPEQIGKAIDDMKGDLILVGHSLGASLILKYLSENKIQKKINGIFLLATPFWSGEEDWVKGLMLKNDFPGKLPDEVPISMYYNRDDQEVSFDHLDLYASKLPQATIHKMKSGGHQFNNDLNFLAADIKNL
jgi:predicted alpha/beta hydrolase family esterase